MDYSLLINGTLCQGKGAPLDVLDPANHKVLCTLNEASSEQVEEAVQAADAAFTSWSMMTPAFRAAKLLALADWIDAHQEMLARLESDNCANLIARLLKMRYQVPLTSFDSSPAQCDA